VRAGVVQVLALEVDLRATEQLRPALGVVERGGASHVVAQQVVEFSEQIPRGQTVTLDGTRTKFTDPDLILGRLADVTVAFVTSRLA
jgi:hypothetical protein